MSHPRTDGRADETIKAHLNDFLGYDANVKCGHHSHSNGVDGHTCGSQGCKDHCCH